MATVAATTQKINKAFYATLYNDENHGVLVKVDHVIYFMADEGTITEYEPEMAPWITLHGEVGIADTQQMCDRLAGGYAAVACGRDEGGRNMTTLTFTQALVQAEAQARSTLDVALHERLSCAVALVKDGAVFQANDHTWTVASATTPGKEYSPNGTCNCDDHHFNKPQWCKHQLAMYLGQRVSTLMRQPAQPVVPLEPPVEPWPDNDPEPDATEPAPAPQPLPLPEMPFSVTLKGTIDGQDALLTARGLTAAEFRRNLAAIHGILDALPQTQAQPQGQPSQATDPTPQCPTHGAMKASTKGKGWYCPTKLDDGSWCPSKGK